MSDAPTAANPTLRVGARSGRWMLGVAGAHFALALLSLWLAWQRGEVASLWFANPVGAVALLVLPLRQWGFMLLGLALANLAANGVFLALHSSVSTLWWSAASYAPGNCAEMLLAAWLLRRLNVGLFVLRYPGQLARVLLMGSLVPALCSSLLGAMVLSLGSNVRFGEVWVTWLSSSVIGSVAVLPLALSVGLQGWAPLRAGLRQPRTVGLVLLSVAITLLATTTLPHPFVVVASALVLTAVFNGFAVTAMMALIITVLLAALVATGVLIAPPSSTWWGAGLFYSALLTTLLPGLFLAASVDGQAEVMQRLAHSEQRFRTLYTKTPAMLHSIDAQGHLLSVSQRWLDTLGYQEHEVLGRLSSDFLTSESARYARDVMIAQSLRDGRCDDVEYQMLTRDGQVLDVLLSAVWDYDAEHRPIRSMAVLQDVTEKKRLLARSHYAEHDLLTGLPNRVLLQDRLERSCAQHARHGGGFAVGFMDLDRFKAVNDTYGHEAGDILLQTVARRLQDALRVSDTVCRLGGDEFVLLFSAEADMAELQALTTKVLEQVAQPCRLGTGPDAPTVDVAASMGVAIYPEHGRDPATLLQNADRAMYSAKRVGPNQCRFFQASL